MCRQQRACTEQRRHCRRYDNLHFVLEHLKIMFIEHDDTARTVQGVIKPTCYTPAWLCATFSMKIRPLLSVQLCPLAFPRIMSPIKIPQTRVYPAPRLSLSPYVNDDMFATSAKTKDGRVQRIIRRIFMCASTRRLLSIFAVISQARQTGRRASAKLARNTWVRPSAS